MFFTLRQREPRLIVLGGSAGALDVLLDLVGELPADLPASVFVALHTQPGFRSNLPELLSQRGPLKATHPVHHEEIQRRHIYIAPPDNQLLVRPGFVEVVRGPKENGHRPAVDALFRTASLAYGPRVIGVVLSGYQDCGTAGMMSIKARGGCAVVQLPESATAAEMPRSVLRCVAVDHIVDPAELPGLLVRMVKEPATADVAPPSEAVHQLEGSELGRPAELVCPACQGVLTETSAGDYQYFRCHVGHGFSLQSLASEQGEELERALWAATRSLEEGATLSRRLAAFEKSADLRRTFEEKAQTLSRQADVIRDLLLHEAASSIPKPTQP